jgi:Ca2+-binding RTX toxin-like protein
MANIVGTSFRDFIHRAGDGFVAGAGDNEIATVTVEADTIDAGIGDDFIHADAENDSIIAGAGADLVLAAAGADTVSGGDGVDTIRGGQGADSLSGGIGNNLFLIETVSDIDGLAESIDGGTDFDELNFTNFNAFGPIDLSVATITGIERLRLTGSPDITLTAAQLGSLRRFSSPSAPVGSPSWPPARPTLRAPSSTASAAKSEAQPETTA